VLVGNDDVMPNGNPINETGDAAVATDGPAR
jgi:hypothetical protein